MSIAVSPGDPELPEGLWEQFTATGTYRRRLDCGHHPVRDLGVGDAVGGHDQRHRCGLGPGPGDQRDHRVTGGRHQPRRHLDRDCPHLLVVTNTADSGPGSLRQAILDSNAATGATNTIDFDIPGPGVQTIAPLSPLPAITNPVLIDG